MRAAGYGSATQSIVPYGDGKARPGCAFTAQYDPSNSEAIITFTLQYVQRASITVFDQKGRQIAAIACSIKPAGQHLAVWDASQVPAGVYVAAITINNHPAWAGKIIIGK